MAFPQVIENYDTIELYNNEDGDGNKYIQFAPLCVEVAFYGHLIAGDSFATNQDTLEVAILNPENQVAEYYNARTALEDMTNLDAVKIEYRKVSFVHFCRILVLGLKSLGHSFCR